MKNTKLILPWLPVALLIPLMVLLAFVFDLGAVSKNGLRPSGQLSLSAASVAVPVRVVPPLLSAKQVTALIGPAAARSRGAVVVGIINPKRQAVFGWGKDISGRRADGKTIFETASLSKVFTGLLFSRMVGAGEVALNQPIDKMGCSVPRFSNETVTLFHLATNTSGLPDWPDNRGSTTVAYSKERLQQFLQRYRLTVKPGQYFIYSNTGFALLGDLLACRAGKSFDALLAQKVTAPLGMKDTSVGLPAAKRPRLAIGHSGNMRAISSKPTTSGGADGVRSTVDDMLKFLHMCIDPKESSLTVAVDRTITSAVAVDDQYDAGLGWFLDVTKGTVEKSGRIAGYRTFVGFAPQSQVGVVVLAAHDQFPAPQLGAQLLHKMMDQK